MKPPYMANGATGFIDDSGRHICTGSMMGRSNRLPDDRAAPIKLHLRHVPFVDYCYDQGGAYWGGLSDLWCAWADGVVIYSRAANRRAARHEVLTKLPNARFFR